MTYRLSSTLLGAAAALSLGACADNYAVEGAGVGAAAGAAVGAVTGGDIGTGAAIGAAAGGVGGTLIKKRDNGDCYRVDRDGREYSVRCPN
ncbi:MAG: glycine zipper domain-containing protein [Erythrobacter sp.]|uniref:YMGG-like glycine zipper-containing protein n=1 Tax=Erythrobacter sp. TaxID=1042 RepID=UPI0025FF5F51|nr:YMGG-like glycine zipper-containing protein [Erythrobacter sp.]MCM0000947.1 glycine zipper domain-containing protein [Erythrobacter sp.]